MCSHQVVEAHTLLQPGAKDGETKVVKEANGGVNWDATVRGQPPGGGGQRVDVRVTALCLFASPLTLHSCIPRAQNFKWEIIGDVVAAPGSGTMEAAQMVRPSHGSARLCTFRPPAIHV